MKISLRIPNFNHFSCLIFALSALCSAQLPTTRLTNPFYVQSYGIPGSPAEQVNLISIAGYNGIMWEGGSGSFPSLLTALQQRNQKLIGIWRNPGEDISGDLTVLKSAGDFVFLNIPSGTLTTESQAVENITRVADLLAPSGRKVAIYPHDGFLVNNAAQAVRLAKLANRPNVGISFNQYHEFRYNISRKLNAAVRLDSLLKSSLAYIYAASISGSDSAGTSVESLIRPLGEGNFDTFVLVNLLVERGFQGVFLYQAYGISQAASTHLANSMTVWKGWQKRLPAVYGCADVRYLEYNPLVNMPDTAACKNLKGTGIRQQGAFRLNTLSQNRVLSILSHGPYRLMLLDADGRIRESQYGIGPGEYPLIRHR